VSNTLDSPPASGALFILLQGLVEQQQPGDGDSALPLPMDHVRYTLSTEERKLLYDYVVEVGILRLL